MREVRLDSGANLKINPAPFADAKALFQAVCLEMKGVPFARHTDIYALFKDLFCTGFASPLVERCLWKCLERCTYNPAPDAGGANEKITPETFEPLGARADFTTVCSEVLKDNILPFGKNLSSLLGQISAAIKSYQTSKSETTI